MDDKKITIFLLDIDSGIKERIASLMSGSNIHIFLEKNYENFSRHFSLERYDIAIITSVLFNRHKKTISRELSKISNRSPKTQILLLVDEQDVNQAISTLKSGTYQYTKLPVSDEELRLLIKTAFENQPQVLGNSGESVPAKSRNQLGEIIGGSSGMNAVYDQITRAAETDIPVLILGETGTGKDLAAQTIHRMSSRSDAPFLPLSLGSIPTQLVASELFGHEKGAFTGASRLHLGVFERGSKGTVFLDEIDTVDEKIQVSLLRLLEQKKFNRLGGRKSITSKTRLIAASNEDLGQLVEQGSFRIDLFYRLDVFQIKMPPLRERKSDIPMLVEAMILKYEQTYKKNIEKIDQDALQNLIHSDWPGNVRELKNVIQRAVLVCDSNTISLKHLPERFQNISEAMPDVSFRLGTPLDEVEKEMVLYALAATKNNKKKAAELLGISRRAIYNKLKKHDI